MKPTSIVSLADLELMIEESTTQDLVDFVLNLDDSRLEMIIAFGELNETYQFKSDEERHQLLTNALEQIPNDVLVEILDKHFDSLTY